MNLKLTARRTLALGFSFLLILLLGSCASHRPAGLACGLKKYLQPPDRQFPFAISDFSQLNVLALSAGGEFGAYGTGFLRGWSEVRNAVPIAPGRIDVVTGVSTGALIATHAFLGKFAEIDEVYTSFSGADVYRPRSTLGILFGNSFSDTSGKDALIERNLPGSIIEEVRSESLKNPVRQLLAGTVDLDSGAFLRVDLTMLAKDTSNPNRDSCFRAVIGAASAIPLAFPPVFIDNMMLVDGGARHHVFLQNIEEVFLGKDVKRRLFAIYHDSLEVPAATIENGILPISSRLFGVIVDQLVKATAYRIDYIAKASSIERRFDTYYADAAKATKSCVAAKQDPSCASFAGTTEQDRFCKPFMQCLSRIGRIDGINAASQDSWVRELQTRSLGSEPESSAPVK